MTFINSKFIFRAVYKLRRLWETTRVKFDGRHCFSSFCDLKKRFKGEREIGDGALLRFLRINQIALVQAFKCGGVVQMYDASKGVSKTATNN